MKKILKAFVLIAIIAFIFMLLRSLNSEHPCPDCGRGMVFTERGNCYCTHCDHWVTEY